MRDRFSKKGVASTALIVVVVLIGLSLLTTDSLSAFGRTGTPVTVGRWVQGQTTYRDPVAEYTFYGRANQYVSIAMEKSSASSRLDPYLQLEDPYGYIVAYDDDSYGNSNSLIDSYRLRRSGTYTILARSYNDSTSGSFWIYVTIK